MKSVKIAFQMDALSYLHKTLDSTLSLARAAALRGYELFHYEPARLRLSIKDGKATVTASGHVLKFDAAAETPWSHGEAQLRDLSEFDVILMRQDPPFDLAYITATHILEHLKDRVRVVNDPVGVRNAPEKLLTTHFPQLMPPTLITRDIAAIQEFREEHKDIIIKPLHGFAGHGIFHLQPNDDNLAALVETMATANREPWMIQKFLPVATEGDKRIVLLDGDPVGIFRRMPAKGDMRGNMRVGGKPELVPMTKRDHEICEAIAPTLRKEGLFLTGIDVIGDYLTEINVTSPTGLVVSDRFENRTDKNSIAEQFWQRVMG